MVVGEEPLSASLRAGKLKGRSMNKSIVERLRATWARQALVWSNDETKAVKSEVTMLINPDGPEAAAYIEMLEEALTPSAATKAAYIGEFSFSIDEQGDDQMCEVTRKVDVPWTTIKEIMAAIRERASRQALSTQRGE
jgi:hypothetical protein